MNVGRLIRSAYLLYFSQPAADRSLLKAIKRRPIRSIVEIGVGLDVGRTQRMLEVAGWRVDCQPLKYTGIDLFESRPQQQAGLSLKEAHHELRTSGIKFQLVPGDPYQALARIANALTGTDLLLIDAGHDEASLSRAWTYIPRMLHQDSIVFLALPASERTKESWRIVPREEIDKLAAAGKQARRAA